MSNLLSLFDQTPDRNWGQLEATFDAAVTAAEQELLPANVYTARWLEGGLDESSKGTPCYKATFEITEGDHAGRRLVHRWWLSPKALPYSKRELARLGITSADQLKRPCPQGFLVAVKVAQRKDDLGILSNSVVGVVPVHIEPKTEPTLPDGGANAMPSTPSSETKPVSPTDLPPEMVDADLI